MAGFDAIVVGGGVVGLSTAYHLVQGGARTLLVDAERAGRATDAGAGILSAWPEAAGDPLARFAARAVRYYPELIERLAAAGAGDAGYAVCGSLTVAVRISVPHARTSPVRSFWVSTETSVTRGRPARAWPCACGFAPG